MKEEEDGMMAFRSTITELDEVDAMDIILGDMRALLAPLMMIMVVLC
jgi:hypothetical protein